MIQGLLKVKLHVYCACLDEAIKFLLEGDIRFSVEKHLEEKIMGNWLKVGCVVEGNQEIPLNATFCQLSHLHNVDDANLLHFRRH